jgi:ABC-2 type transport system permease protein
MTKNTKREAPWFLSMWLVAGLFFKVTLGRRALYVISIVLLVPIGMAVYWRIFESGIGLDFFQEMSLVVFLQFFAIGLPLYLGVSAIRDEIEDKTIVYLLARPIRRGVIVAGKIVSVVMAVWIFLAIDMSLVYLILVQSDGWEALWLGLTRLLVSLGVIGMAVCVYTALFFLLGLALKRPMIIALVFGLGWELTVSNLPAAFPKLTLMYYLKSLLGFAPEATNIIALFVPAIGATDTSMAMGVLVVVFSFLLMGCLVIGGRKEYRI